MYLSPTPAPALSRDPSSLVGPARSWVDASAPLWDPLPTRGTFAINGQTFGGSFYPDLTRANLGEADVQKEGTKRGLEETKVARPSVAYQADESATAPAYKIQQPSVDTRLDLPQPGFNRGGSGVGTQVMWGIGTQVSRESTGESAPARLPLKDVARVSSPRVDVVQLGDRYTGLGARYDPKRSGSRTGHTLGACEPLVRAEARPGHEIPSRPAMVPQSATLGRYPSAGPGENLVSVMHRSGAVERGWQPLGRTLAQPRTPEQAGLVDSDKRQAPGFVPRVPPPKPLTLPAAVRSMLDTQLATSSKRNTYTRKVR